MNFYKSLKTSTVFLLIFAWVFSGWPQIFNFPSEIQEARAALGVVAAPSTASILTGDTLTLSSMTGALDELLFLHVTQRNETIDPSVSGFGLTWDIIVDADDADAQMGIKVYRAQGTGAHSGDIVITVTGNTLPVTVQYWRVSGAVVGNNGADAIENITTASGPAGATDDNDMTVTNTITDAKWNVGFAEHRNSTYTLQGDEVEAAINFAAGSGGDLITSSLFYSPTAVAQLGAVDSLSAAKDWVIAAIGIKEATTTTTTAARKMRLFAGFKIRLIEGKIILRRK